ncbi:DUF2442 domain-containing protein [Argonema galeatum]|uniref:DUF2442 domain-containing protein n=1 Tax=Argonema galeatum TaxID=2942762 RepID=UPI002010EB7C|nr:DUF2442 domain-containing protein [Argonema galeatum]MCL1464389.1 DUF2442 domain-containing protein [Argonema galeatum A003/A1]
MENQQLSEESLKEEIAKARAAAVIADVAEPRAKSAYYDANCDRIVIELRNGASFLFPPQLVQGLAGSSANDLAEVEVTPSGEGLHWETLDVDLSIPYLMVGIFGTKVWMAKQRLVEQKAS